MRVLCIIIHSSVTTNQTIISSLPLHCIGLGWPRDLQWLGSAFSCLWPQTAANDDHDVQYTHRSIWHKQKTSRQMASAAANQTTSHISALQSRYINYNLHFERNETQRSKREKEKAKKKNENNNYNLSIELWHVVVFASKTSSHSLTLSLYLVALGSLALNRLQRRQTNTATLRGRLLIPDRKHLFMSDLPGCWSGVGATWKTEIKTTSTQYERRRWAARLRSKSRAASACACAQCILWRGTMQQPLALVIQHNMFYIATALYLYSARNHARHMVEMAWFY